jgi:hypothetical protein
VSVRRNDPSSNGVSAVVSDAGVGGIGMEGVR